MFVLNLNALLMVISNRIVNKFQTCGFFLKILRHICSVVCSRLPRGMSRGMCNEWKRSYSESMVMGHCKKLLHLVCVYSSCAVTSGRALMAAFNIISYPFVVSLYTISKPQFRQPSLGQHNIVACCVDNDIIPWKYWSLNVFKVGTFTSELWEPVYL